MRIAISGSHSIGKTTIIEELKKIKTDYHYFGNITRSLKKYLKINEEGNDETQKNIIQKHIEFIEKTENDNVNILDRCILDGYVYTFYLFKHNKISSDTMSLIEQKFKENIKKYDIIFFIEPEFDIVKDNVRSLNKEFRDEVNKYFNKFIKEFNIKVIKIKGSIQERVQNILKEIENESKSN